MGPCSTRGLWYRDSSVESGNSESFWLPPRLYHLESHHTEASSTLSAWLASGLSQDAGRENTTILLAALSVTPRKQRRAPLPSWHPLLLPQWMQNVLGQVLDALEYLHHLDIIHR